MVCKHDQTVNLVISLNSDEYLHGSVPPQSSIDKFSPPFDAIWGMIVYQIRLSHSRMVTLLSKIMDQQVGRKKVTTLGVISRSLNDSTQTHTREGVQYRLDISWSHFKEQRGELPPGSAELFKNVILLIRVPMAHPNHNCQHAPRNTIRNLHMLPNFFFYQFTF